MSLNIFVATVWETLWKICIHYILFCGVVSAGPPCCFLGEIAGRLGSLMSKCFLALFQLLIKIMIGIFSVRCSCIGRSVLFWFFCKYLLEKKDIFDIRTYFNFVFRKKCITNRKIGYLKGKLTYWLNGYSVKSSVRSILIYEQKIYCLAIREAALL